ncbi:hypothetical protein ANCCAN_09263 [Ancylostoma caninum]|uniref:Uncharacterized protein n=1 Tax=Ancylostoma caninum TaxID=29170 RepID=A0A368GM77_ANCCA|nr:hypothetical protein ANCCAN_09263 [Ancylostoma caninum]
MDETTVTTATAEKGSQIGVLTVLKDSAFHEDSAVLEDLAVLEDSAVLKDLVVQDASVDQVDLAALEDSLILQATVMDTAQVSFPMKGASGVVATFLVAMLEAMDLSLCQFDLHILQTLSVLSRNSYCIKAEVRALSYTNSSMCSAQLNKHFNEQDSSFNEKNSISHEFTEEGKNLVRNITLFSLVCNMTSFLNTFFLI